jgi:hypothetical protein
MPSTIYGIRHHGPGSARRLREAFDAQPPDLILIEGPPEGDALLASVGDPELHPPVALLLYQPDRPERAAYYPFARFSPEWQAMRWAAQHRVPVRFIDLSPAYLWKMAEQTEQEPSPPRPARVDWLGVIAQEAGYSDGERWWEAVIEQRGGSAAEVFAALQELIQAVRQRPDWEATVDDETLLREAYMRREIRKAEKKADQIAVVCGAFHAPVLAEMPPAKADNARLKGLKKTKSAATWIPWTYERLSLRSGYGAGVTAPAWYELLFDVPSERRLSTWMTRAAQLFRAEGLDASPAHAIEAGRLAHALSHLRGKSQPTLEEMLEAVQSVFAQGSAAPMQLVEQALIIGQRMGEVPDGVPELPLQQHVRREQKRLRMKPQAGEIEVKLDLRQDFQRDKSYLLHRLDLLGVRWGQWQEVSGALGTFREEWRLRWQPECELALIEAAFWGNTLDRACLARVRQSLKEQDDLPTLTQLLERVFLAGLGEAIPFLVKRLHQLAATDRDPDHLLETLPALVNVLRYGDVRELPAQQVRPVIDSLAPRLMLGLPGACRQIDDEFAEKRFQQVLRVHQAMQLLSGRAAETGEPDHRVSWQEALDRLQNQAGTHPRLAGMALRLLFEQGVRQAEDTAKAMARTLSPGTPVEEAAAWVEGFLHGSGALLIYQPSLWRLLDQWVGDLSEDRFQAILPLLRRTFSRFAAPERRRMGELAKREGSVSTATPTEESSLDFQRVALVEEVLEKLLGS